MRMPSYFTAALLTLSLAAVAQTKVCIGGNLDSLSAAQITACKAKSDDLQRAAQTRGTQGNWHFVMVCDEAGWSEYASFTGNDHAAVMQSLVQTDAEARTTFVRSSRLQPGDLRTLDLLLDSIAHTSPVSAGPGGQSTPPQSKYVFMARR